MKKIISLALFAFLISFGAQSQTYYNINFNGNVADPSSFNIPNLPLTISVYDSMGLFVKTINTTTDLNGNYSVQDTLSSFNPVAQYHGHWILTATDCDMSTLADSNSFIAETNSFPSTTINLVYCTIQFQPPCGIDSSFTYTANNNIVTFTANTIDPNLNYTWIFSGDTMYGSSVTRVYHSTGTYGATLLVDSGNCVKSSWQTFVISSLASCDASFSSASVSGTTYQFTPQVIDTTWTYTWDFGDGNTSNAISPMHTYASTSTVTATLTVSHGNYCNTSSSETISMTGVIHGIVTLENLGIADEATVFLIEYQALTGILTAVDSTQITFTDSGWYHFNNVPNGVNYLVKAALNTNSAHYSNYIPAYHSSSVTWSNATQVMAWPAIAQVIAPIELPAGVNPGGPGFIGGLVSQGANKRSGKELENVLVMLFDQNNNPLMYTYSDNEGKFEFSNLALGTYVVYTEVSGIPTNSLAVDLTAAKPEENRVRVEINSSYVETFIGFATNVNQLSSNTAIKLYPNPVNNELNIVFTPTESNTKAHIIDVSGKTLISTTLNNNGVNTLNTESLSPGMYLLRIESSAKSENFKFVK